MRIEVNMRKTILEHLHEKSMENQRSSAYKALALKVSEQNWKETKIESDDMKLFALDCEMVETKTDTNKLIRVSVVEYDFENDAIITRYDELVHPGEFVVDYRTIFHGILPHQIEGAKITFADAQQKVFDLIPKNAYIVGHSLDSDLQALKIYHEKIIDTALIFSIKTHPKRFLALRDVTSMFLETEECQPFGKAHDSVLDASWALKIILKLFHQIRKNETYSFELDSLPKRYLLDLNIFGLPEAADVFDIPLLFPNCQITNVRPLQFKYRPNDQRHKMGSTTATFISEEVCKQAFAALPYSEYNRDVEGFWKKKTPFNCKGRIFHVWVKTFDSEVTGPPPPQTPQTPNAGENNNNNTNNSAVNSPALNNLSSASDASNPAGNPDVNMADVDSSANASTVLQQQLQSKPAIDSKKPNPQLPQSPKSQTHMPLPVPLPKPNQSNQQESQGLLTAEQVIALAKEVAKEVATEVVKQLLKEEREKERGDLLVSTSFLKPLTNKNKNNFANKNKLKNSEEEGEDKEEGELQQDNEDDNHEEDEDEDNENEEGQGEEGKGESKKSHPSNNNESPNSKNKKPNKPQQQRQQQQSKNKRKIKQQQGNHSNNHGNNVDEHKVKKLKHFLD